jgi:hypothetical protein
MPVTINASTSTGLVQTADTSGVITLQNNGTNALTVDSGNLQFNSGYGSVATAYGCRSWVNFDASSGTPSIRGSGNVSSITDNGVGDFTINFTNAMPDVNYSAAITGNWAASPGAYADPNNAFAPYGQAPTTSALRVGTRSSSAFFDYAYVFVQVFR